jgi:very-short-patch-repair endonuclease
VRGNADGLTKRQQLPADTTAHARSLRRTATEPEKRMWNALRIAFPDGKWRRQVPIGRYFADFCSHRAKLVIEIDGDSHADTIGHDAARTTLMEREGYRVVRFANADVMANPDGVIATIAGYLATSMQKGRP